MSSTKKPRSRKGELRGRCWIGTLWEEENFSWTQIHNLLSDDYEWICQKERCPDTGRLHFHLGIYFKNPVGIAFQQDWPKTVHWEKGRNWRAVKKYCSKRDTRVEGPWTNISGMVFRRTRIDPMDGLEWHSWQFEIKDIIDGPVDRRKIYWYWDREGGIGKTVFTYHICMHYAAMVLGGTHKDALYGVKVFDDSRDLDIVIFDLPRSSLNHVSYRAIEDIKNGIFYSSKYECGMVMINSPHVIVFANMPPDVSQLSMDRWVIQELH